MRPTCNQYCYVLILFVVLSQTGCQDSSLSRLLWPDLHDPYSQLTQSWSRDGVVRHGLESETRVVALLKSKEWRTGYVRRYAEAYGLTSTEREKMLADELRAAEDATEFVLAVSSTEPDDARLTHRLSQWRVLLLEEFDQTVTPLEIRPMEVHESQLQAFYPHYLPWQRFYNLSFPKKNSRPVRMLFTGPHGQFILTWNEYS